MTEYKIDYYNKGIERITLPDHSRVWIFQADRFLTEAEADRLQHEGTAFASAWKAHGKDLGAQFAVVDALFAVMAADETREGASGCSIDGFMRFMLQAQEVFGLSFTNRMCVAYLQDREIHLCHSQDLLNFKVMCKLTPETPVFDNLITTLGEFKKSRLKPAGKTWLGSFLINP